MIFLFFKWSNWEEGKQNVRTGTGYQKADKKPIQRFLFHSQVQTRSSKQATNTLWTSNPHFDQSPLEYKYLFSLLIAEMLPRLPFPPFALSQNALQCRTPNARRRNISKAETILLTDAEEEYRWAWSTKKWSHESSSIHAYNKCIKRPLEIGVSQGVP